MIQKFFDSSIYSKTIKYILSQTPLPMYRTITSDQTMHEGCIYIYRNHILKCTKTGFFVGVNSMNYTEDHLYVTDSLTVSNDPEFITEIHLEKFKDDDGRTRYLYKYNPDYLKVTSRVIRRYLTTLASFVILDDYSFGEFIPGITQVFNSNRNYYDTDTHRYLGQYLRCLRDIKGIDLMSLYNCFEYKYIDNIIFKSNKVTEGTNKNSKITLIPIRFNQTYTIAIDCPQKIKLTAILYKDMLMKDSVNNIYLTDKLQLDTIHKFTNTQFSVPITYKLDKGEEESLSDLLKYEKYLYLAIELPENNNSTITVLEGDYTKSAEEYVSNAEYLESYPDIHLSKIFKTEASLLKNNDKLQHPFSDKLLEYILKNTIDNTELNDENITRIEKKIGFDVRFHGNWSNKLRYLLYVRYLRAANKYDLNKYDILGFVDSDIENAIEKGYLLDAKG